MAITFLVFFVSLIYMYLGRKKKSITFFIVFIALILLLMKIHITSSLSINL
ncbi:MAG: DUF5993 family protein [Solitalea-like symbiont of Tyrophagus putrescentiae]